MTAVSGSQSRMRLETRGTPGIEPQDERAASLGLVRHDKVAIVVKALAQPGSSNTTSPSHFTQACITKDGNRRPPM
jgi:hypothetical protein